MNIFFEILGFGVALLFGVYFVILGLVIYVAEGAGFVRGSFIGPTLMAFGAICIWAACHFSPFVITVAS